MTHTRIAQPDLGVKKSAGVEKWAWYRENTTRFFKFTRPAAAKILIWAVLVPVGTYMMCRSEDQIRDKRLGMTHRKYM